MIQSPSGVAQETAEEKAAAETTNKKRKLQQEKTESSSGIVQMIQHENIKINFEIQHGNLKNLRLSTQIEWLKQRGRTRK